MLRTLDKAAVNYQSCSPRRSGKAARAGGADRRDGGRAGQAARRVSRDHRDLGARRRRNAGAARRHRAAGGGAAPVNASAPRSTPCFSARSGVTAKSREGAVVAFMKSSNPAALGGGGCARCAARCALGACAEAIVLAHLLARARLAAASSIAGRLASCPPGVQRMSKSSASAMNGRAHRRRDRPMISLLRIVRREPPAVRYE